MAELKDLAVRMRTIAAQIPINTNELKKQVVRTILNDLAYVTPVDTSQALSNWQVGLAPIATFIPPHYPGERGSSQGQSAQEAIAEGETILAGVKAAQPVYVGNAAPYIVRLNEGYSSQEPAGFVERAVILGRLEINKVKLTKGL